MRGSDSKGIQVLWRLEMEGPNANLPVKVDTSWRRMAAAIFEPPRDGKLLGSYDLDMRKPLAAMEEWREQGHHVTVTHFVMSMMGHILGEHVPELNCYARWGRVYKREKVTIATAVLLNKRDLTTVKIADADKKSVLELAAEMTKFVDDRRSGRDDKAMSKRNGLANVPWPLRRWVFKLMRWLVYEGGITIPGTGFSNDLFGSILITNIGSLGLEYGFPALMPASNLSTVIAMGRVRDKAVVIDGEILACPMLPLAGAFDHRVVDGAHVGRMVEGMKHYCNHPEELLKTR
jgi:hypothetical protein